MLLAQLTWKKCEDDGLIVARIGVLDNDLAKVWQPTQPYIVVRQLRDWFAQFPYLSKLREPQVLAKAISEALARSDAKYAIADSFDEAKGEYVGLRLAQLVTIDLNSDVVLVHREVADAQLAKQAPPTAPHDNVNKDQIVTQPPLDVRITPRPRRFYAKITLDPNRPTPMVSNIAQSILSELDRARGDDHADTRYSRGHNRRLLGGCREYRTRQRRKPAHHRLWVREGVGNVAIPKPLRLLRDLRSISGIDLRHLSVLFRMEKQFYFWEMFFLHIVLGGVHKGFDSMPPPSRTVINGRFMGHFIRRGDRFPVLIDLYCPTFFQNGGPDLECMSSISEYLIL
jgi:hypothetical protein